MNKSVQTTGRRNSPAHEASVANARVAVAPRPGYHRMALDGVVVLGIGSMLVAAFALHSVWMLQNHDVDFNLIVARRILAGGEYMRDFVGEPNPPLTFLLSMPPVMLATPLGLDTYTAFSLYACLLIAVSAALSWPILHWCFRDNPIGGRLFLLAYVGILAFEPGYDFGQREHLAVILFCPGLFWFAAREIGRPSPITPSAIVITALAAIAMLIKPFYLLVPAGMLALRAAERRSWRVLLDFPVAVFLVVTIVYVAAVLVAFPGFLAGLAVVRQVYFAWNRSWLTVLDASRDTVAALSLAIVLTELAPLPQPTRRFLRYGCVASVVCLVMAFLQHKGWPYHLLPARELALIVLAFVAVSLLPKLSVQPVQAATLLAVIVVATGFLGLRPLIEGFTFSRSRFLAQPLIHTLRQVAAGKRVLLLTGGYLPGFPSLADVKVGAHEPGQPLLPGTVKLEQMARTPAQRAQAATLRQLATRQVIDDLARYHPAIVAVDIRPRKQALPDDFDVLRFYERDEDFRRAWSDYHLAYKVEGWDLYNRIK